MRAHIQVPVEKARSAYHDIHARRYQKKIVVIPRFLCVHLMCVCIFFAVIKSKH
jgi:hypothetical protein